MGPTLLEQLREQTRPAHLALETQPLLQTLMSSQLTLSQYGQLVQAMCAFYQALESKLVPATTALLGRYPDPDYRYLPRGPFLADDCLALGGASTGFMELPVEFRLDSSDAYLLGVLYVIEGSSQGGRLISRHLASTLGISSDSGASFFNLYQQGNSWPAFRRWLGGDLSYTCRNDFSSIIEGAEMTFTTLQTHLDKWPTAHGE